MIDFGGRLAEERKRLKLTQTEMAQLGGVQLNTQFNYEKGNRNPDSAYLAAIAAAGADVAYIITGVRSQAPAAPQQGDDRESRMLALFRRADEIGKDAAERVLFASEKKPTTSQKAQKKA